jgi:hypothetical protein
MKLRSLLGICMLGLVLTGSVSCKKAVEEQYNDIIKKLMTDGTWFVTGFTENGTTITSSFNGWVFKFNDNNTVTATKVASVQSGTWQSNVTSQTIAAQFAATVGDPLVKLNGTWNITTSTATVGNFTQTKSGVPYTMELTKY